MMQNQPIWSTVQALGYKHNQCTVSFHSLFLSA